MKKDNVFMSRMLGLIGAALAIAALSFTPIMPRVEAESSGAIACSDAQTGQAPDPLIADFMNCNQNGDDNSAVTDPNCGTCSAPKLACGCTSCTNIALCTSCCGAFTGKQLAGCLKSCRLYPFPVATPTPVPSR